MAAGIVIVIVIILNLGSGSTNTPPSGGPKGGPPPIAGKTDGFDEMSKTFTSTEGRFSVPMPGKPAIFHHKANPKAKVREAHTFWVEDKAVKRLLRVYYTDATADELKGDTDKLFRELTWINATDKAGYKPVTHGMHKGLEFLGKHFHNGVDHVGESRVFLIGARV